MSMKRLLLTACVLLLGLFASACSYNNKDQPGAASSSQRQSPSASAVASAAQPKVIPSSLPSDLVIKPDKAQEVRPRTLGIFSYQETLKSMKDGEEPTTVYSADPAYPDYSEMYVSYRPGHDSMDSRVNSFEGRQTKIGSGSCGDSSPSLNIHRETCLFALADGGFLMIEADIADEMRADKMHEAVAELVDQMQ